MKGFMKAGLLSATALPALSAAASCLSQGDQNTINQLFQNGGANTKVQLCPGIIFPVTGVIQFTAAGQEISTQGYPHGDDRATIQVVPGHNVSTMVTGRQNGLRVLNIKLDGNRRNAGFTSVPGSGAIIEMGGEGQGQLIQYTASFDPTSWSCLHIIGSGNDNAPCAKNTVRDNDIGPCGHAGTNAQGQGQWADGISMDCTDSLVQNNTVNGPTDGGIVLFGSPGTVVDSNTIISSETDVGFGAINMVDGEYAGSYKGVVVSNNVIIGKKMFNVGISIGAFVWSFNDPFLLSGPATIVNNTFQENIPFSIAVNGWQGGLTVSGNDVSGINHDKANFSGSTNCGQGIKDLWNAGADLVYEPDGILGQKSLQSGFVAADQNITNFLCTTTAIALPDQLTFDPGFTLTRNVPLAQLKGVTVQYQVDNNVVFYDNNGTPLWASGGTVHSATGCAQQDGSFACEFRFDSQGGLATYYQGAPTWTTNTTGLGHQVVAINAPPYLKVVDARGSTVWDTQQGLISLPAQQTFQRGFSYSDFTAPMVTLDGPYNLWLQGDGNLVMYDPANSVVWAANASAASTGCFDASGAFDCGVGLSADGALSTFAGSTTIWSPSEDGQGYTFTVQNHWPWLFVSAKDGSTVWHS